MLTPFIFLQLPPIAFYEEEDFLGSKHSYANNTFGLVFNFKHIFIFCGLLNHVETQLEASGTALSLCGQAWGKGGSGAAPEKLPEVSPVSYRANAIQDQRITHLKCTRREI